jgi:hypothetical protein
MKLAIKIVLIPLLLVMLPIALMVWAFDVAKAFVEHYLDRIYE